MPADLGPWDPTLEIVVSSVAAAFTLLIAYITYRIAKRSARSAKDSATAARDAAKAAEMLTAIEARRLHEERWPHLTISFREVPELGHPGRVSVIADVGNAGDRDYEYRSYVVPYSGDRRRTPHEAESEGLLPAGMTKPLLVADSVFRPESSLPRLLEQLAPAGWDCPCDRPHEGHWLRRLEVPPISFGE